MEFQGRVWIFKDDDINTDLIYPGKYTYEPLKPEEQAKHAMEDYEPDFSNQVRKHDLIVAGKNFGCGSSREHAPIAIKASGMQAVIARSFARIFYRNSFNIGLPIFESADASSKIKEGDMIEIDADKGTIKNLTSKEEYAAKPIPPFMQELINTGGLIEWTKKRLKGVAA